MNQKNEKFFTLVLHAHLPFVIGHGQWPHGMDWLNEAAAETYIPLLNTMNKLANEGTEFALTIDISPVLGEQMNDDRFKEGFIEYLDQRIAFSENNIKDFAESGTEHEKNLAEMWRAFYKHIKSDFIEVYNKDLITAFRKLEDEGYIEIITCGATHGYFPLLYNDESINAQLKTAVKTHERLFGKKPKGIWLPECAYRPRYEWKSFLDENDKPRLRRGVEELLNDNGIEYFIIDTHLLKGGKAIGNYLSRFGALQELWDQFSDSYNEEKTERNPFNLYWAGNPSNKKAAAVFTRNDRTSLQVWSGEYGYPGNGVYLDFHKKHSDGGIKYWAVTGSDVDMAYKQSYIPENTEGVLEEQSAHFAHLAGEELANAGSGVLTAPFDCELFGHWWFEGPRWIKKVFEKISKYEDYKPTTLKNYFKAYPPEQVITLPEGSWGEGGFHYVWLNERTEWTWGPIHKNEKIMIDAAERFKNSTDKKTITVLTQMGRELLLQQASDWQFLITTWSASDYAEDRLKAHDENFKALNGMLLKLEEGTNLTPEEEEKLNKILEVNSLFTDLDFRNWLRMADLQP
ncbi:MAG: DUF1957 domain-containing protein [Acidobacteria bacterium]|nr:DUF1957 domain-containing protein [Acidobacteriota bacterium]